MLVPEFTINHTPKKYLMSEMTVYDKSWKVSISVTKDCPEEVKDALYKMAEAAIGMLSSEPNPEECDARDDAQRTGR